MYRIISGKWRGRRINAPKNFVVRPTTDYAKEGLFNILRNQYDFNTLSVIDLFAGIGSISFEFCSRGVNDIRAVDSNRRHCQFIEDMTVQLDCEKEIKVIQSDVFQYLEKQARAAHIIFADAPFEFEASQYEKIVQSVFEEKLILNQGQLILEHSSQKSLEMIPHFRESRKYGNVSFSFFE